MRKIWTTSHLPESFIVATFLAIAAFGTGCEIPQTSSTNQNAEKATGTSPIAANKAAGSGPPLLAKNSNKTGNVANDRLLALGEVQQAAMLGQVVGEGCIGETAFYDGIGKKGGARKKAFWSVRCTDGNSYMVEIDPDANGSTQVLECSVMKAVGGGECFKKFGD